MSDPTPTVLDYFNNEFDNTLRQYRSVSVSPDGIRSAEIVVKEYVDVITNARFSGCYIPARSDVRLIGGFLLTHPEIISQMRSEVHIAFGSPDTQPKSAADLVHTGKYLLYIDELVPPAVKQELINIGATGNFDVEIRDHAYLARKQPLKPLVFISHDSRNKKNMARPLAIHLGKLLVPTWYDEFSLKAGQSLKQSIENGLQECKKCVVLATRQYLSNKGWAKAEFDSVFTRERIFQERVFLPVWFRVSKQEVYNYCPLLADAKAIKWVNQNRVADVASQIKGAL